MNVGLDVVLNIRHLNLIVYNISRKVPKLRNFFLSLEQFMEDIEEWVQTEKKLRDKKKKIDPGDEWMGDAYGDSPIQ
jgi:hypothetical protein